MSKFRFKRLTWMFFNLGDFSFYISMDLGRGKIGGSDLSYCQIKLYQDLGHPLHVVFANFDFGFSPACTHNLFPRILGGFGFFGGFNHLSDEVKEFHRCVTNENSTTQLWFWRPYIRKL